MIQDSTAVRFDGLMDNYSKIRCSIVLLFLTHWVTSSFAETKVLSLEKKVWDKSLRLKFKTLISAKDKVTHFQQLYHSIGFKIRGLFQRQPCVCECEPHMRSYNITQLPLRPIYRSTCVSLHLQLRTGKFCWCKVLQPRCKGILQKHKTWKNTD